MEGLLAILLIALIALPFVTIGLAIAALSRGRHLSREVAELRSRLQQLERGQLPPAKSDSIADASGGETASAPPALPPQPTAEESETTAFITPPAAPSLPSEAPDLPKPPPIPSKKKTAAKGSDSEVPAKEINWEAFMGGKLFAWIGGLTLFLGLAFFVRYSFEHDLISPATRVILGSLSGIGLLIGGWFVKRKTYEVTSQTLCATGILTLYACVFASSHAFYGFFSMPVAFVFMVVVTVTAFVVSVRLNGQAVAVLGLLGGFLTPVLLSTGRDHSIALFTYIGLLDLGLVAVAIRQKWRHLVLLAAAATITIQIGWAVEHFAAAKVYTAMAVLLGFEALFCAVFWWNNRSVPGEKWSRFSAVIVSATTMLFALVFFTYGELASRPWLVLSYVLVADVGLLSIPFLSNKSRRVLEVAAGLAFLIFAAYTLGYLTDSRLNATLPFYVLFGLVHGVVPILLRKLRPLPADQESSLLRFVGQLTPLITLLLVLFPMMRGFYAFAIWPTVLFINIVLVGVAAYLRSAIVAVGASLVTFIVAAMYIATFPSGMGLGVRELLAVTAGFGVFFFLVAMFLGNRFGATSSVTSNTALGRLLLPEAVLSACSGVLPFMLLTMSIGRLGNLLNPSSVFSVALLLSAMLVFIALRKGLAFLGLVALAGVVLTEASWFGLHFSSGHAIVRSRGSCCSTVCLPLFHSFSRAPSGGQRCRGQRPLSQVSCTTFSSMGQSTRRGRCLSLDWCRR